MLAPNRAKPRATPRQPRRSRRPHANVPPTHSHQRDGQHSPFGVGNIRTLFDVALVTVHYALLARALTMPQAASAYACAPFAATLLVMGARDHTFFLASRSEHYLSMTLCTIVAGHQVPQVGG